MKDRVPSKVAATRWLAQLTPEERFAFESVGLGVALRAAFRDGYDAGFEANAPGGVNCSGRFTDEAIGAWVNDHD